MFICGAKSINSSELRTFDALPAGCKLASRTAARSSAVNAAAIVVIVACDGLVSNSIAPALDSKRASKREPTRPARTNLRIGCLIDPRDTCSTRTERLPREYVLDPKLPQRVISFQPP